MADTVKTTLELPAELVRELKLKAVRENRRYKDVAAEVIRDGLLPRQRPEQDVIRHRATFPLIRSTHPAPPGEELTAERLHQLEEEDDLERSDLLKSDARLATITASIRDLHRDQAVVLSALVMAEEVGEAVQQIRRQQGLARSPATEQDVAAELADVVIAANITAHLLNTNLADAVDAKLSAIIARGVH